MNYPYRVRIQLAQLKAEIHSDAIEKGYLVTKQDIDLYVSILLNLLKDDGWIRNEHDKIVCYDDLTAELKKCVDESKNILYMGHYFD